MKQAENFCVLELVKKIESHPHPQALQADLQQNSDHNPFSGDSKAMIREMGNDIRVMRNNSKCAMLRMLFYWNQGTVYCTCGHLLRESESSQHFHQWRLDAFSVRHYVFKKGRPRGARPSKIEAQKQHFLGHTARRRCIKKIFDGIHYRFQRDPVFRVSQLKNRDGYNWHRKVHRLRISRDMRKTGKSH